MGGFPDRAYPSLRPKSKFELPELKKTSCTDKSYHIQVPLFRLKIVTQVLFL